MLDNGGANSFSSIQINNGTVQVGNDDANGSIGPGNMTNNGLVMFNRMDTITVSNLISGSGSVMQNGSGTLILDRKSTRLNSSHLGISYAVFCLKKKNKEKH